MSLAHIESCDSDLKYGEYGIFRSGVVGAFLNRNAKITATSHQIGPIVACVRAKLALITASPLNKTYLFSCRLRRTMIGSK